LSALPNAFWITSGVVAGTLVVTAGLAVATSGTGESDTATVERVVDGDTIDVRLDGTTQRVRLLNVDTPETVDPDQPVQCMGPEATAFLTELLPAGTSVELTYDQERRDRYDRVLAGVFLEGQLVNAMIAAEGLGVAALYEPNDRFYDAVLTAQGEARDAGAGLFGTDVECTLPAQVARFADAAGEATQYTAGAGAGSGVALTTYDERIAHYVAATAAGATLAALLDSTDVWTVAHGTTWLADARRDVATATGALTTAAGGLTEARAAEVARLEAERLVAEAAEAARVAAERAAQEAEAARQAEAAREAESARQAAAAERDRQQSSAGSSSGSSGSGGGSGYTGCRKYAPGGKTWTPIPCP
jgi:micrococcal nuclease